MGTNNARLTDINLMIQAGIDPKTGLPLKFGGVNKCALKKQIKQVLRVQDEQTAVNRYKWHNLPSGLDGQLLERIIYYKFQGAFFYIKNLDKFFFLPYALDGTIDVYGRYQGIRPVSFGGPTENEKDKKADWISNYKRIPIYDMDNIPKNAFEDGCVLLSDYTRQYSQLGISRQILNDGILDAMAEAFPFARTSLVAHSGVKAMRVTGEEDEANVNLANDSIEDAALTGKYLIPIVSALEFQDLTDGGIMRSEEYLLYMQALDNFRLSLYGIDNGGLFEKKAQKLETEQTMNSINDGLVYEDGLLNRQKFCDLVNLIWGLGIWCEQPETLINVDADGDGDVIDDSQDMAPSMEQNETAIPVDSGTA